MRRMRRRTHHTLVVVCAPVGRGRGRGLREEDGSGRPWDREAKGMAPQPVEPVCVWGWVGGLGGAYLPGSRSRRAPSRRSSAPPHLKEQQTTDGGGTHTITATQRPCETTLSARACIPGYSPTLSAIRAPVPGPFEWQAPI